MKGKDREKIKQRENKINDEAIKFCQKMQFSQNSSSIIQEAAKSILEKK